MTAGHVEALTELLAQAQEAHGTYEATELKGVYDEEWPRWYAWYAVEHGIGGVLGHPVTTAELARFLASTFVDFQRAEPSASEPWAAYTARRLAAEL